MSTFLPPVAVLCSGGLDSAVLLVEMGTTAGEAIPVFVRAGHVWEPAERLALERFVAAVDDARIRPARDIAVPMHDVLGSRWPMSDEGFPEWDTPDQANEIRGRNLVLLAKTLVVAAIESWPTIVLASLRGNPFPDATPSFLGKLAAAASEGLDASITIAAPYRSLTKADVIRRGAQLPLDLTMSCARPTTDGRHCGTCNKCRERSEAFVTAGVEDRTQYERRPGP
jgi:7-cyano-7-deazaguanine synthase